MSSPPTFFILAALITFGYGLLWWLTGRVLRKPLLRRALLLSYTVRVLLAVGLYATSYLRWPLFRSLQAERGFWSFGLDSPVYHYYGMEIARAWRLGIELPKIDFGFDYFAVVAGLYGLLGAHPLYPIIVNSLLASVNGLLAYVIGRRLFNERAGFLASILVGFWPSSLIWSTQLLKDTLTWFLICSALVLVAGLISVKHTQRQAGLRQAVLYCLLGVVVIALTRLRFYLGSALTLSAIVVLVPFGASALIRKRAGAPLALSCGGIVVTIAASMFFARTLNTYELLSPPNPEETHYGLALQHWQSNQLDEAVREFNRAIALRPHYEEAYLGLGAVQVQQAYWEGAISAYEKCLELVAPKDRPPIQRLIPRLYAALGNNLFRLRNMPGAIAAYEHSLTLDPSLAETYANLGLALVRHWEFERAFMMSEVALRLAHPGAEEERVKQLVAQTYVEKGHVELTSVREAMMDEVGSAHLEAAFAAYERAIALNPSVRGDLFRMLGIQRYVHLMPAMHGRIRDWFQSLVADGVAIPPEALPPVAVASRGSFALSTEERAVLNMALMPAMHGRIRDWFQSLVADGVAIPPEALPPVAVASRGSFALSTEERAVLNTARMIRPRQHDGARKAVRRKNPVFSPLDAKARSVFSEASLESLGYRREGFISSGGSSLTDPRVHLSTPQEFFRYLPRALAIGLFAPFPWQWFDASGSTGMMRSLASLEMALFYLLVPGLYGGILVLLKQRRPEHYFILCFLLLTAIPVSVVVANLGTLFRLRLLFLLPLLVIVAGGDPFGAYRRMFHLIGAVRGIGARGTLPARQRRPVESPAGSWSNPSGPALVNAADRSGEEA